MARRSKNDQVGIIPVLFVVILPFILAAVFFLSVFYIGFLIFPLLYLLLWGKNRLLNDADRYNDVLYGIQNLYGQFSATLEKLPNLKKNKSGKYDERSYNGKDANRVTEFVRQSSDSMLSDLNKMIFPYRLSVFTFVSVWILLISVVSFNAFGVSSLVSFPSSVLLAILISAIAYAQKGAKITEIGVSPDSLPQINITFLLSSFLAWALLCGLCWNIVENEKRVSHKAGYPEIIKNVETSTSADAPVEVAIEDIKIMQIPRRTGFITSDTEAKLSTNIKDPNVTMLLNGTEVSVDGESEDKKWLRIKMKKQSTIYYVPSEAVAIFSD